MTPARARTRRRLAGLAASLAVHGALLLAFMSVVPRLVTLPHLPAPPEEAFQVELQRPSAAPASATASARLAKVTAPPVRSVALPPPRPAIRPSDLPAPAPPAARTAAAAPGSAAGASQASAGASADDGRWRVKGAGDAAGDAARALARGTVGCGAAEWLHLTADERDHCNAEFVHGMRTLKPDAIPAAKRAYYDAVVAAYAKMHAPMPMSEANLADSHGVQERWHAPEGSHIPGFGCGAPFGKPRGWKTYANRKTPPHALKLGALPCFITPPSGFGTEEADVPPPASLREQQDDAAHAAKYAPPGGW